MRRTVRTIGVFVLASTLVSMMFAGGTAVAQTTRLRANLTGAAEVPGPGDPNGEGLARVRVDPAARRICFTVRWAKIGAPFAAHIHRGKAGVAGPVKVTLFASARPLPGTIRAVTGCVREVARPLARRIVRNPQAFYVNVHNAAYPDGAIRGQLVRL